MACDARGPLGDGNYGHGFADQHRDRPRRGRCGRARASPLGCAGCGTAAATCTARRYHATARSRPAAGEVRAPRSPDPDRGRAQPQLLLRSRRGRLEIGFPATVHRRDGVVVGAGPDGSRPAPNLKGALAGFFARALIPPVTVLMLTSLTSTSCESDSCNVDLEPVGMGLLFGATVVELVDTIFWARASVRAPPVSLALVPHHGGARLAFGARF
jgi:hypothetical protein